MLLLSLRHYAITLLMPRLRHAAMPPYARVMKRYASYAAAVIAFA